MKIAADAVLDQVCKVIARHRETINDANLAEKEQKNKALDRMLKTGKDAYTAWGVELLVSHSDKLRVRLVDETETGAGQPDDETDEVKGEQGDLGTVEQE